MKEQSKSILSRLDRPIALVGMMGSGKSMLGRKLARRLGLPFVDSDRAIEDAAGLAISDIFEIAGNEKFRELEKRTIADLVVRDPMVLATGGGSICAPETARLLLERTYIIWLQAAPETLLSRIGNTASRPMLAGGDPLAALCRLVQEREQHYQKAHIHLNTDGMSSAQALTTLVDKLDSFLPVK